VGNRFDKFTSSMFNAHIYPQSQPLHFGSIIDVKTRYQNTLTKYKELFGDTPSSDLWESIEERFKDTSRASINIFRMVALKGIAKHSDGQIFTQNKEESKVDTQILEDTKSIESQRKKAQQNNEAFGWRKQFPHCSNIYAGEVFSKVKGDVIPIEHEEFKGEATVFQPGGVLFTKDPFKYKSTDSNIADELFGSFYSTVERSERCQITLDDLADNCKPRCVEK
jgi:hypothetical protein